MNQLATVLDKSWLEQVCNKPPDEAGRILETLQTKHRPLVSIVLVEEVLANWFDAGKNQTIVNQMIQRILKFHPSWIDHPLEWSFKELVLGQQIKDIGLESILFSRMHDALTNPGVATDLREQMGKRLLEKKERRARRKKQQEWLQKIVSADFLHPLDLATFVRNGICFLEMSLSNPNRKRVILESCLGQIWKRWHVDTTTQIEDAFARLDYQLLLKLPFTYSYLLAELLYDFAPITNVGPLHRKRSNPQVLSGNQINHEEDQEYVTSALHCDRLLTCDAGMHRMADVFQQAGLWKGACILIPPNEVDQLGRYR